MIVFTVLASAVVVASLGASIQPAQQKSCSAQRDRGDYCATNTQSQMFYFNSQQGMCQPFMYNGCGGNGNRFSSAKECQDFCVNGAGAQMLREQTPNTNPDAAAMKQACSAEYDTTQLNVTRCGTGATNARTCPAGTTCTNGFCCYTPDYLCNINYDAGKFSTGGEKSDRYFFTKEFNTCMRFSYYGTLGNANNFPNYNACIRMCGSQRRQ